MATDQRKVIIRRAIIHWPNLLAPRRNDDGSADKYGCQVIIPKDAAEIPALKEAMKQAKEKSNLRGKCAVNFHDGDAKDEDGNYVKDDACYRGHYYFNASAKKAPGVVIGKDRRPATEDDIYAGAGAAVSVTAFGYNREGNRGVSWGLNNVWITDTTLPVLAGRASAEKDFEDVEDIEISVADKPVAETAGDDDDDLDGLL